MRVNNNFTNREILFNNKFQLDSNGSVKNSSNISLENV